MKIRDLIEAIDPSVVMDFIERNHHTSEDFEDGDLVERIYTAGPYTLHEVSIMDIDNPWNTNPDLIEKYAKMYDAPPPIVLDSDLLIIDGAHRYEAGRVRGDDKILAYVGENKQFKREQDER